MAAMASSTMNEEFEKLKKIPKLELHAHLNGSLSEATIRKCGERKRKKGAGIRIDQTNFKNLNSCFEIFDIAHKATNRVGALRLATMCTIQEFADDEVAYLELRTTPRQEGAMSKTNYLLAVEEAIAEARTSVPSIFVTLLVSINRSKGVEEAEENVDLAIEFSTKTPAIVVGVDFSGNPTKGHFRDFIPTLNKAREAGLRLTIHCGEVDNPEEVDEILNFGADRLGHVTCLTDAQLQRLKREKIPVELCVSSNVLCATVPDFGSHHLKEFLNDHPFILGTDDKAVFNTCLSKEYTIVQDSHQLSLEALWNMNWNAVDFIFADEDIKNKLRNTLKDWKSRNLGMSLKEVHNRPKQLEIVVGGFMEYELERKKTKTS